MESCCNMKGFLSFIVLVLISKKNMSGEEIRVELKKRRGSKPSPGTIYPVLKSLSEKELIQEINEGGKVRTYEITKKGQKELKIATKQFVVLFCDIKDEFQKV